MVEEELHIQSQTEEQKIWKLLEEVKDPEVPVLSIIDLGIIRNVETTSRQSPEKGRGTVDYHTYLFRLPCHGCYQNGHSA